MCAQITKKIDYIQKGKKYMLLWFLQKIWGYGIPTYPNYPWKKYMLIWFLQKSEKITGVINLYDSPVFDLQILSRIKFSASCELKNQITDHIAHHSEGHKKYTCSPVRVGGVDT